MQTELLSNIMEGIEQGETPVRVQIAGKNVAYDIMGVEMVGGVAYIKANSNQPHIVPAAHRED